MIEYRCAGPAVPAAPREPVPREPSAGGPGGQVSLDLYRLVLGKPQKNYFLSDRATKRGGGLNRCATKEKELFLM